MLEIGFLAVVLAENADSKDQARWESGEAASTPPGERLSSHPPPHLSKQIILLDHKEWKSMLGIRVTFTQQLQLSPHKGVTL